MEAFYPFERLLKEVWSHVPLRLPILALNVLEKLFGLRTKGGNIPQERWNLSFQVGRGLLVSASPRQSPDPPGQCCRGEGGQPVLGGGRGAGGKEAHVGGAQGLSCSGPSR